MTARSGSPPSSDEHGRVTAGALGGAGEGKARPELADAIGRWENEGGVEGDGPPTQAASGVGDDVRTRIRYAAAGLAEITQAVAGSLEVSRIYRIVAAQAGHILVHDALVVLLQTPTDDPAVRALAPAFAHPPAPTLDHPQPATAFSFGPDILAERSVVVMDIATTAPAYAGDQSLLDAAGRSAVIVPIRVARRVLGCLLLISRAPGTYHPDDTNSMEPVAGLLALALEHQRLNQQASALAVMEERNRLAREIHDTLAQSLTGIIINLESLKPYAGSRGGSDADVLAATEALARDALEETRRSVLGLQPTPLQYQALPEALASEVATLAKRAGLVSQFYVHGDERPLAPDVAAALFRIAQEAFQNIYRHAAARHVILGLAFEDEAVVLTIEDDGRGFLPGAVAPADHAGFGLLSMAARARTMAGDVLITSRPGHGTAVRATLPYARPGGALAAIVRQGEQSAAPAPEAHPIRILVVDDQPVARQGIRRILEGQPDIEIIGEAEDGLSAVEQTGRLHPDVVLLDLQLPGLSGVAALPRLRAAHPGVEVVILTMFDQDEQVFAGLKAGARGYVLKDALPAAILAAVRAASHGDAVLAPAIATRLVARFSVLAQRDVDPDSLTERELEVLRCMERGMPYKEIAVELSITSHTVQYHVTNILQKLAVGSRGEAVAVALQRGLLGRAN